MLTLVLSVSHLDVKKIILLFWFYTWTLMLDVKWFYHCPTSSAAFITISGLLMTKMSRRTVDASNTASSHTELILELLISVTACIWTSYFSLWIMLIESLIFMLISKFTFCFCLCCISSGRDNIKAIIVKWVRIFKNCSLQSPNALPYENSFVLIVKDYQGLGLD